MTAPIKVHITGVYGLIGNLLAMPLVSVIVMPAGLAAMLAMPFGLEGPPLAIMATGIDAVLWVAHFVAGLEGAARYVAAMHPASLTLMMGGMLWPKRFSSGSQPRTQPAPASKSRAAGIMMLSVLKIQPVRIAI